MSDIKGGLLRLLMLGLFASPPTYGFAIGAPATTEVFRKSTTVRNAIASKPIIEEEEGVLNPTELGEQAARLFVQRFGRGRHGVDGERVPGVAAAAFAPGRVNLIGEHTDYNGGFVMPLALQHGTAIFGVGGLEDIVEGRPQTPCIVASDRMPGEVAFVADAALARGELAWGNFVKGVVAQYVPDVPAGKALWFRAFVSGTVPIGGGVSSSASLSVAVATFVEEILARDGKVAPPTPTEKALRCQKAEHVFVLTPCGIMDQFVSAMARPGHAMLLDCRSRLPRAVPLADPDVCILVTNSNVVHSLGERGSQYPVRVAQCAAAVEALNKRDPAADISLLRDATLPQLEAARGEMDDVVFRRARHVVTENKRCVETAEALAARDYAAVGRHMIESHRSLREDYEVSCPELDVLVRLAMEVDGVYGCRLTGAGFGGCTVSLVRKESVGRLTRHLEERYFKETGLRCRSFVTSPGGGAHALPAKELLG